MSETLNSPRIAAETLVIRQQIIDLEDELIELTAEAQRLTHSAEAREAFVAALRAPRREPVGMAATPPPPSGSPTVGTSTVLLPALAQAVAGDGTDGDISTPADPSEDTAAAFFSKDVDPEPARAWLLSE